jgi:pyruvate ferredoxin oxidoreductase beta subunit
MGQVTRKKNVAAIAAAHDIPYVATACPSYRFDLMKKVRRGAEMKGPAYVHILSPCPTGWRYGTDLTIKIGHLAVQTGIFPLYEIEYGRYRLNADPPQRKPIEEYLKLQGRYRHLTGEQIARIQEMVNEDYAKLKEKVEDFPL